MVNVDIDVVLVIMMVLCGDVNVLKYVLMLLNEFGVLMVV